MTKNYVITSEINEKKWDDFVAAHPLGNIFQTSAMFEVYSLTKGYRPLRFWAVNPKTQEIGGVLMGLILHEKEGLMGALSTRANIHGGPLTLENNSRIAQKLLDAFDQVAKQTAIWSEIHNLYESQLDIKTYALQDHLNYLIDLTKTEPEMWAKVRPTRRKNIRTGQNLNKFQELVDARELPIFCHIVKDNYARVKIPLSDASLFRAAYQILVKKGLAKIFFAKHNQVYAAGRLILVYKKTLYDWYAGAKTAELKNCPNDFLVWEILQWGRNHGFEIFDFGGAGKPNVPYGPRDFKRQFGGELVNFGWPTRIFSPWKYRVAHWGLKVYQWGLTQLRGGKR